MKALLTLITIALLTGCTLIDAVMPVDWHYEPAPVEQPDTVCTTYDPILNPPFVTVGSPLYNGFNPSAQWGHNWVNGQLFDSLEHLLTYLNYTDFDVYYSDDAVVAIIRGTNETDRLNAKIYTRDLAGVKTYLAASVRGFAFYGALPYQDYLNAATTLPSVRSFNFLGTDYDSTQYITIASTILDAEHCKGGQWFADFRFNPYPMTDSIKQLYITAGWEIVLP